MEVEIKGALVLMFAGYFLIVTGVCFYASLAVGAIVAGCLLFLIVIIWAMATHNG